MPTGLWRWDDGGLVGFFAVQVLLAGLCRIASVGQPKKIVVERSWKVDRLVTIDESSEVVFERRLSRDDDPAAEIDRLRRAVDSNDLTSI